MKTKSLLVGAAFSGLLLAAAPASAADDKGAEAKGECHGVNECKGTGACGGKGHSCAGKNVCKGKGWLKMTKAECTKKKGKWKKG
ncbi:MAG: hypothetical protein AB8G05_27820 [Oligoflexales bacterium]